MRLLRIPRNWQPLVEQFCQKCADLNYKNNASLKAMKWYDKEIILYGHYTDHIISLSGAQPFKDGYRVCYRGATLPGYAIPGDHLFKREAIQAMNDLGKNNYYITTAVGNDHTKGARLGRALKKGKIWKVKMIGIEHIYNVDQTVWLLDDIYLKN